MPIAFRDVAKLVVVALPRDGRPRGHRVLALEEKLRHRAAVEALRLERFHVRLARGRQHVSVQRAAVPVLIRETGGGEEGPAVAAIPEEARARNASRISCEIRPPVVVDVCRFLPVSAAEERGAPAARERAGDICHGVSRAARRAIEEEFFLQLTPRAPAITG